MNMNKSYSKIRHIQESNLILEKRLINEDYDTEINKGSINGMNDFPTLKELKPYGLKYSVKLLKNLLTKSKKPDGTFRNNKWIKEEMPFPPELTILNVIFQSKLAEFWFKKYAKSKGKEPRYWDLEITKESLDNFPLPPQVFNSVVDILTNKND